MEQETNKQKKKVITKAICVIIAILLMIGIAFIVANIVHKNSALPASANVKNGLSAYELAAEQGYDGSLEDWLKSLNGKSAYEIAVENGYTGTEDEWNKAIANVSQNNVTIKNAEFSKDGDLIITLSDGTTINVGKVAGSDGKDGANGKNGTDGKNGVNGKDGINGANGADGRSISSASVNADGQLILAFSDGSTVNLDKIVGAKGDKGDTGEKGADGRDGVGINNIIVTEDGNLNITLSSGTTLNLGTIKGADGIGISKTEINTNGELVLTYTNGEINNLGKITGRDGANGSDGTGIKSVTLSADGELIIILSDNSVLNLGNIKGEKGDKGADGKDGRGIEKTELVDGELIITYTDGTTDNLGKIGSGETEEPEYSYDDVAIGSEIENDGGYRYLAIRLSNSNAENINIPPTMYISAHGGYYLPVGYIYNGDFESATLKSVTIPKYCAAIEENTFSKCPNLNEAYFEVTTGWKNAETGEEISESTIANPYKTAALLRQGVSLSNSSVYKLD